MKAIKSVLIIGCTTLSSSQAFVVPSSYYSSQQQLLLQQRSSINTIQQQHIVFNKNPSNARTTIALQLHNSDDDGDASSAVSACWSPGLRRVMGGIASLGVLETSFLTWNKLQGTATSSLPFCGVEGSTCSDVLNGPYAYLPLTEIPLSAMGFMAYLTVVGLSLFPLTMSSSSSQSTDDNVSDATNRALLMGVTTAMATFSIFLLTLLFGVLQQECPYCELSATFSISLALLAWIGGCLPASEENPQEAKTGAQMTATGFLTSTVFAVFLFLFAADGDPTAASAAIGDFGSTTPSSILAAASQKNLPPPITTESSDRAISLAKDLQSLDARMFGAFWCSHCYDQKETLGKEAFSKIPYIECSKDGINSQTSFCKSKDVPGFPTWEINGKLYPGEQSLEELEEVVAEIKKGMTAAQ
mmetsp:Transcript_29172/g.70408  ORF Transcript_29172/g.70408 Transcript_29172/m.70408 type:complete len:415 (-) Transcript_29172:59-1303(-)